jgi:hypothetical protein
MLQGVSPLSLIFVTICSDLDPKTIGETVFPLADIGISFGAFPHPITMFSPLIPFAFIGFAISPNVLAPAFGLPTRKLS